MIALYEIPIALSMVELAKSSSQPIQKFLCYWIAFNNIYSDIAEKKGYGFHLRIKAGKIKTKANGSVQIPQVYPDHGENEYIQSAFDEFDETLKNKLVSHPNFDFFVNRKPMWQGRQIEFDANGQKLNGVINVKKTVNDQYPHWSPIDFQAYERYINGRAEKDDLNLLAKQILFVLYSIRNNTVHAGKRADDSNDLEIVEKSLPLLEMIVDYFILTA